ncbi:Alpha/Beta hydrolase protein, partial [Mycena capillaripes]
ISSSLYDDFVRYTKYSSAAYQWRCPSPLGNKLVHFFSGSTHGFIARDEEREEIVVSFRGTLNAKDVITDIRFFKVLFDSPIITEPVYVHKGFLIAYKDVFDEVLATVKTQLEQFPTYSIVVTAGHSLGGAIASLVAAPLKSALPNVTLKLYTFGQPRAGNTEFARYVEKTLGLHNIFR